MLQSFIVAVNAVIPFIIYLLFGYYARVSGACRESFLNELNSMLFKLMFPFVTFYNIYSADIEAFPSSTLLIFAVAGFFILQALLLIIVPRILSDNRKRGAIIQAVYRSNFILFAMPMVLSIYGESAGSVTALMVTIVVTLYNITSVIILEIFRSDDSQNERDRKKIAKGIAVNVVKNPFIQGAAVGLIFFFIGIKLPQGADTAVKAFSNLATPMALFVLGGTLNIGSIRNNARYIIPTLTVKLIIVPLIMVIIGYMLGLRTMELFIILSMYGTPVAVASFTMAQNMGSDGELAGQLVVFSTITSLFTLFLWIFSFNMMGLLY